MRQWTDAQRADAATRCRLKRPWKYSTGPRTALGKYKSSCNSYKHGRFTYEKQLLRWYLRLAIHRNKQIRTYLRYEEHKHENELIEKWGLPVRKIPHTMAFYPYFKVHPLAPKPKQPKKHHDLHKVFDYLTSLSDE